MGQHGGVEQRLVEADETRVVLEAVKEWRVVIRYIPTSLMNADGLTKPLEGKAFDFFAKMVLGHDNKSTGGR